MKSGVRFWGVLVVLLAAGLFAGTGSPGQAEMKKGCLDTIKLPCLIMWEPEESNWSLQSKAGVLKVVGDLEKLINDIPAGVILDKRAIQPILDIYGENGFITGHDGLTYRGSKGISEYLNSIFAAPHQVSDFRIQIKFVYAKEFSDVMNARMRDGFRTPAEIDQAKKKFDQDIVHSIYFILSNSFILDGKPIDPPGSTECPHIRMCECNRNK